MKAKITIALIVYILGNIVTFALYDAFIPNITTPLSQTLFTIVCYGIPIIPPFFIVFK